MLYKFCQKIESKKFNSIYEVQKEPHFWVSPRDAKVVLKTARAFASDHAH